MARRVTSFTMSEVVEDALTSRPGPLGTKINQWLAAMTHIIRYEKTRMRGTFSLAERAVLIDAYREMPPDFPGTLQGAINELKLAERFDVDGEALTRKLDSLTPAAQYALRDALDLFETRLKNAGVTDDGNNTSTQEHLFDV